MLQPGGCTHFPSPRLTISESVCISLIPVFSTLRTFPVFDPLSPLRSGFCNGFCFADSAIVLFRGLGAVVAHEYRDLGKCKPLVEVVLTEGPAAALSSNSLPIVLSINSPGMFSRFIGCILGTATDITLNASSLNGVYTLTDPARSRSAQTLAAMSNGTGVLEM